MKLEPWVVLGSWLLASAAAAPRPSALLVKASPVAAPCVAAAVPRFERDSGQPVLVETAALGPKASAEGADVIVGADEELTHIIEGGASNPDVEADVATIPWVFVGAAAGPTDLRALERSNVHVRVLAGVVGRSARESLQGLPAERVRSVRGVSGLLPVTSGELALLPQSLAGSAPTSPSAVPPLLVRAVAAADTGKPAAARRFVEFLAGAGNPAFRACGRGTTR